MHNKKFGLIGKLIMIAIVAVVITAVALVSVSSIRLNNTYEQLIMEELKATAEQLNTSVSSLNDEGDWSLGDDGIIYKGGDIIMEEISALLDTLQSQTGIDYTIFYGDTRYITTIYKAGTTEKLVGTKASDAVIANTLTGGEEYAAYDLTIEGTPYMGYYTPLKNSDGSIVGMVFTGRPSNDVTAALRAIVLFLIAIAVVIVAIVTVIGFIMNKKISAQMGDVSDSLNVLSQGTLDTTIGDDVVARTDELGMMGASARNLIDKISDIITKTKTMSTELSESGSELARSSNNASGAAMQVSAAVDEISKGAINQAENIQTAVTETDAIGQSIISINHSVDTLNEASDIMKNNCSDTQEALDTLIKQSEKVSESVDTIARTIDRTNKSAKDISEFTEAINSIAAQTNLLSLNASIEAARAGEAGKGFAVVAGEISNLASQSKDSADKINAIVTELMKDTQESVEVMNVLAENNREQSSQLDATKESMDRMSDGIQDVTASADDINDKVQVLEKAKASLNTIIEELSAISEENAATTEETNASMEELSATFSIINESADDLQKLAGNLAETMSYFK